LYTKYPPEESELWCNYGNWQGKLEYAPKWHYGEGTWVTFEGLRVRIPENYDAYLTQKYGDWRSDPPLEKQKSHHVSTIIDTEKPYTFYTNGDYTD
jgi:lipopolysaccharide cholinephosphotransferase